MRFKILRLTFIIMVYTFGFLPFVHAQEYEISPVQKEEELSGVIEQLSFDPGVILLKSYQDVSDDEYREDTIFVQKEAKIEKDNNAIKLTDLSVGQKITARCNIVSENRKEATHIWVESEQQQSW